MNYTAKGLCNAIINASNFIIRRACEHTSSGQYYVNASDVASATGMDYEDVLYYQDEIMNEMYEREEILDVEFDNNDYSFSVNCALNYCPSYNWCDGDEEVFECTYEEWLEIKPLPIVDAPFV